MVADSNLKSETLVGYVDRGTINQAVVDAIRASGGSLIKNPYYRKLDAICASAENQVEGASKPASAAAVPAFLDGIHGVMHRRAERRSPRSSRRKKHAQFHKNFKLYTRGPGEPDGHHGHLRQVAPGRGPEGVSTAWRREGKKLDQKFVKAHGAHGLSCF